MDHLEFPPAGGDGPAPLIVFLHGRDESLDRTGAIRAKALPYLAEQGKLPTVGGHAFPFLVVCPQAAGGAWQPHFGELLELVGDLIEAGRADKRRCYVTGLSMGAFGCWSLAAAEPGRFAAIVPVSGGVPDEAEKTGDTPAWVFAGGDDRWYKPDAIRADLAKRRTGGAETTFTVDPRGRHHDEFWNRIYVQRYLYEWLLQHQREG